MTQLLTALFHFISPLWEMSLTAAFVAVIVLLLRLILKERAPRQMICLLWLIVFARLLLPVSLQSPVSLVPELAVTAPAPVASQLPETVTPTQPVTPTVPVQGGAINADPVVSFPIQNSAPTPPVVTAPPGPSVPEPVASAPMVEEPSAVETPFSWQALVAGVWAVGLAAIVVYGVASYLSLRRKVRFAIRNEMGFWEDPNLRSPFILGLFRPKIYLPWGLSEYPRHFILCHEQAHIRRRDHIVKPICWLALAIHWFNPAAWVAFLLMSRDIEVACDQSVLRQLGTEVKADYSATLLSLATNGRFPAPTPLAFGEGDAKTRIKGVLNFKKPALWVTIAAMVVAVVAAVCLLTDPVEQFDPEDYTTSDYYPGLYFQEETDQRYGHTTAKAYRLVDGKPELVAGYTLLPGNNYDILIRPDGTEEQNWAAPMDTIAIYEQYLADACEETDPDWAAHCLQPVSTVSTETGRVTMRMYYTPEGNLLLRRAGNTQVFPLSSGCAGVKPFYSALRDIDGDSGDELVLLWADADKSFAADEPDTVLYTGDHLTVFEWDGESWTATSLDLTLLIRDNLLSMRRYDDAFYYGSQPLIGEGMNIYYDGIAVGTLPSEGSYAGYDKFEQGDLTIIHGNITLSENGALSACLTVCPEGGTDPLCYLNVSLSYRDPGAVKEGGDLFSVDSMEASDSILIETDSLYTQRVLQLDYYPGLYFLEETGGLGLMALTAYKVVDGEQVNIARYEYHPDEFLHKYTVSKGDGSDSWQRSSEFAALAVFEEIAVAACMEADPDWLPADAAHGPYVTTQLAPGTTGRYDHIFRYTTPYGNLLFVDTRNNKTVLLPADSRQFTLDQWSLEDDAPVLRAVLSKDGEADWLLVLKYQYGVWKGTLHSFDAETGGLQFINEATVEREGNTLRLTHNLRKAETTLPDAHWLGELRAVVSSDFSVIREEDERYYLTVPVHVMDVTRGITVASFTFQGLIENNGYVLEGQLYTTRTMSLIDTLEGQDVALYSDADGTVILQSGSNAGPIAEELYPNAHSPYRITLVSVENGTVTLSFDGVESTLHETVTAAWSATEKEWVKPVTAEELAEMTVVASLPEHDLTLYRRNWTSQFYLQYQGHIALLDTIIETGRQQVQFFPGDRNGDGVEEILILHQIGYGTGCDEYGLMACWVDGDGLHVERHDYSALMDHFTRNNTFTYEPMSNTLSLSYQGQRLQVALSDFMKTQNWSSYGTSAILTDEIVGYTSNGDGTFTLRLAPALSDGVYLPEYLPLSLNYTIRFNGSAFTASGGTLESFSGEAAAPSAVPDQTGVGQLYLSALRDETEILEYTGSGFRARTLDELLMLPDFRLKIASMAAVDLDGDLVDELLLSLSTGTSGYGTAILRYNQKDGKLYGYTLWARAFNSVKTDGTFTHSSSAFDGGIARLAFTDTGYDYEDIAYSKLVNDRMVFFIGTMPATEEQYNDLYSLQMEKPAPDWVEYSEEAAETFITEYFHGGSDLTVLASLPEEEVYLFATSSDMVYLQAEGHFGPVFCLNDMYGYYRLSSVTNFRIRTQTNLSGPDFNVVSFNIATRDGLNATMELQWAEDMGGWDLNPISIALATLPRDIVTPETLPDNPDWYYKVAEAGDFNLFARNHGQEVFLQYGNLSWTFDHAAHSTRWSLPRMMELDEQTVAVISEVNTGTQVEVDELVVYECMTDIVVDDSHYFGARDYVYDWRTIAGEFNRSNTLVYDKDTNSFTLTYGGKTYPSGTLPEDLAAGFGLEDGFTGALIATGNLIRIAANDDNTFTVTMQTAIARGNSGSFSPEYEAGWFWYQADDDNFVYPLSIGSTGFELTWKIAFRDGAFQTYPLSITVTTASPAPLSLTTSRNRLAAATKDFYVIREDGTLIMWGSPEGVFDGSNLSNVPMDAPVELMDHVVFVDVGFYGGVYAIDETSTLWGLGLRADPDAPNEPLKIMEEVAMVSAGQYQDLILKKDGTLWYRGISPSSFPVLETQVIHGESYYHILNNVIYATSGGYGAGSAILSDGTQWEWDYSAGLLEQTEPATVPTPSEETVIYGVAVEDVADSATGEFEAILLKTDGSLWLLAQDGTFTDISFVLE